MTTNFSLRALAISLGLLSVLSFSPVMAAAETTANASASTSVAVVMGPNQMVHVFGATVQAVTGSVINATTAFGNTVLNWIINVGPETKLLVNGAANATTSDIAVGDKISFKGSVTGSATSTLAVDAKKVKDITRSPVMVHLFGTIANIDAAAKTFLLVGANATTTVHVDNSTKINGGGKGTISFGDLVAGNIAAVIGTTQTDGSLLASHIVIRTNAVMNWLKPHGDNEANEQNEVKSDLHASAHGLFLGLGNVLKLGDK